MQHLGWLEAQLILIGYIFVWIVGQMSVSEGIRPDFNIVIIWTLIFEWCVVRRESTDTKKACV